MFNSNALKFTSTGGSVTVRAYFIPKAFVDRVEMDDQVDIDVVDQTRRRISVLTLRDLRSGLSSLNWSGRESITSFMNSER